MDSELDNLIDAHRRAVRAFGDALYRSIMNGAADDVGEDFAFDAEAAAMLALLCFSPTTIEEARTRAAYLMKTRFPDTLDVESLALLLSFVNREMSA